MVSGRYKQKGGRELKFNFYDVMYMIDDDCCVF